MSKAENFIKKNTRHDSNVAFDASIGYVDWLNPYQARLAVRIARGEIYEWLNEKLPIYIDYRRRGVGVSVEEFVNELKQAMKDE